MESTTEPRVGVSPEFYLRVQELKQALLRLDVQEKRLTNHPKAHEIMTALGQEVGLLPPPVTPREVLVHRNVMRLLRGDSQSPPPPGPESAA